LDFNNKRPGFDKAKLTKRVAVLCLVLSAPYFFIFGAFDLRMAQLLVIPTVSTYVISLVLIRFKKYSFAKLLIILGTTFLLF
jgi:hypothetical protein